MKMTTILPTRRTLVALAILAAAFAVLAGARPAPSDIVSPVITLGPTTVANGVALVSGTVTTPWAASAQLTVNGQPLDVSSAGQFNGTANLAGDSALSLAVRNPTSGEVSTINVPLTSNLVGAGGVVPPQVLSGLDQAAATITKPLGGFVSVGDKPITVGGGVGNPDQLVGLSVNGIDALSTLKPNGTFSLAIPGTSKDVDVVLTDKQGVSLETTNPVAGPPSSRRRTRSAYESLRFASTPSTSGRPKRVRMIVTVKDRRGLRIRGAVVTVKSLRSGSDCRSCPCQAQRKEGPGGLRSSPEA